MEERGVEEGRRNNNEGRERETGKGSHTYSIDRYNGLRTMYQNHGSVVSCIVGEEEQRNIIPGGVTSKLLLVLEEGIV